MFRVLHLLDFFMSCTVCSLLLSFKWYSNVPDGWMDGRTTYHSNAHTMFVLPAVIFILYRFRSTNCHNSRFRTHRMKCNNSSFRFRYENSSGLCKNVIEFAGGEIMGKFLFNKLWLVMVISTACAVTYGEPKPTQKSRVVDRVCLTYSVSHRC